MAAMASRVTFGFDGNTVRVLRRDTVETITPPGDAVPSPGAEQHGFWVELHDREGAVLYRRVIADPLRGDMEVFSPRPADSIIRVPSTRRNGSFTVLLPDLPGAEEMVLMSSGAPTARLREMSEEDAARSPLGPALELARFSATGSGDPDPEATHD